jgi:hypothetical protein
MLQSPMAALILAVLVAERKVVREAVQQAPH